MKEEGDGVQIDSPIQKKTTFKKPSLIGVTL